MYGSEGAWLRVTAGVVRKAVQAIASLKPFSKSRLASMGVSEEMAGRINAQIRTHVDARDDG
ncbi:hypothetical protein SCH4B_3798 [Ruegeria sp. TrichCH4B]|nr:hypothetical protein SCH4B_3798 [Ruegeria sp. TrichCH4B]